MNSFLNSEEIKKIGFKAYGINLYISRYANFYNPQLITIGNNVRIDDFCILSGEILIKDYVHIAAYSALYGGPNSKIELEDFVNISSRVSIYSKSDDYSGKSMSNPLIPSKYKNVTEKNILISRHSIIGASSVVLPGVKVDEGSVIGALSLVNKNVDSWSIYAGIPIKKIKSRSKKLLKFEKDFISDRYEK